MKTWLIALLLICGTTSSVAAHPHVFITPQAEIILDNHYVSQINVQWIFDAFTSAWIFESCDSNKEEIWNMVFPKTQFRADGRPLIRFRLLYSP